MARIMSNLHGLETFDTENTNNIDKRWQLYREEVDLFIQASGINSDTQKRAILLHSSGKRVREIFSTLQNKGTTYDEACTALDAYFKPHKNIIYDRWLFRTAKQRSDETAAQFIVRLRTLADTCEYLNKDEEVRDQFVCGCCDKKLMEKLLCIPNLTIKTVAETSSMYENAKEHSQKITASFDESQEQVSRISKNTNETKMKTQVNRSCYNCGNIFIPGHKQKCPAKNKKCNFCGILGHFEVVCRKAKTVNNNVNLLKEANEENESVLGRESENICKHAFYHDVSFITNHKERSLPHFRVSVNNESIVLLGDTGATCSCLNYKTFIQLQNKQTNNKKIVLSKTNCKIGTFGNNDLISPIGKVSLLIEGNQTYFVETFYVMPNNFENILSKVACEKLGFIKICGEVRNPKMSDSSVNKTSVLNEKNGCLDDSRISKLTDSYNDIFEGEGLLKNYEHKIYTKKDVKPVVQRLRRYPHQIRDEINEEIDRLERLDFIEKVNGPSDWVSNMVVTYRKNGKIRLCLDARAVNNAIKRQTHPIPTLESIVDDLYGAKYFSKVDLRQAYCQVLLDDQSRNLTTFITERGLMRYKRMIFGLTCASEDFQKIIENCFSGLEGVKCISDDVIIYSKNLNEHIERIEKLFGRIRTLGLKLNLHKCQFLMNEISFFGVVIGKDGVKMDAEKVKALDSFRPPENTSELKSFLGFATFCSRFIPNFSTLTGPLRDLLRDGVTFHWSSKQQEAFRTIKDTLRQNICLSFYNPKDKCKLITDASDYGLGAVLLQTIDNEDRPIAFASRSLTELEKKYTTTEKECLALVFAVQKFHTYLFGSDFEAYVDHKPLESLNNPNKKSNARIERWIMTLQSYTFKVIHKSGKDNIADCFSRLMSTTNDTRASKDEDVNHVNVITKNSVPRTLSLELVRCESKLDAEIVAVIQAIHSATWTLPDTKLYKEIKDELTENDGILLKGTQIVLPKSLRQCAINIAHQGHMGINKTVGLLRTKVFWPKLHQDVVETLRPCLACQAVTPAFKPEPLKSSQLPNAPWCEISADFHGPLPSGEKLLVILDEYSRFPIVHIMRTTTADAVINKLDGTFSLFGYPDEIKTDNGPPFDSNKLAEYLQQCSIHHRKITPLHPQSNAKCERFMRVIGKTLKTAYIEGKNWRKELDKLLFNYRNSPHTSTGFTPAILFFNRSIKTGLPEIIKPINNQIHDEVRRNDARSQEKIAENFNKSYKPIESNITVGDKIFLKQIKRNQLSSYYDPKPYIVTHKKGSMITVSNDKGSYTRDISYAKKVKEKYDDDSLNDKRLVANDNIHEQNTKRFRTELKIYPLRNRPSR